MGKSPKKRNMELKVEAGALEREWLGGSPSVTLLLPRASFRPSFSLVTLTSVEALLDYMGFRK
jgi:hypothetical protein